MSCSTATTRIEVHGWRCLAAGKGGDEGKQDLAKDAGAAVVLLLLLLLLGREILLVVGLRLVLVALGLLLRLLVGGSWGFEGLLVRMVCIIVLVHGAEAVRVDVVPCLRDVSVTDVDVKDPRVLLVDPRLEVGGLAELLDRRFQLGDPILRVKALPDDAVQRRLVLADAADDALLQDVLGLLHVQAMQVDVVVVRVPVVFDEYVLGGLGVVLFGNGELLLRLGGQLAGPLLVPSLVRLLRPVGQLRTLRVRLLRILPVLRVLLVRGMVVVLLVVAWNTYAKC